MSEEKFDPTEADVASLGDVVIVISDAGRAGVCFFRGHSIPLKWEVSYGEKDDPPLSIRRFTATAGWTQRDWRKGDQPSRNLIGLGSEDWRAANEVREVDSPDGLIPSSVHGVPPQ